LAVKDTRAFVVVMAFCTAAATNAYYIIRVGDSDDDFKVRLYANFLKMFRLIWVGDFDLYELDGGDTILKNNSDGLLEHNDPDPSSNWQLVHILFLIVCIFLTIAMLNLLVGILGANYERYEALSLPLFLRERAHIISSISCRVYGSFLWAEKWRGDKQFDPKKFLWAALKKELDPDDQRSLRAAMEKHMEKHLDKHADAYKEAMQTALNTQAEAHKKALELTKDLESERKKTSRQEEEIAELRQQVQSLTEAMKKSTAAAAAAKQDENLTSDLLQ